MRLPHVPTPAITANLNRSFFTSVWNAPDANGRVNFSLQKVSERVQKGAVSVNLSTVGLPTVDVVYAVYIADIDIFSRFSSLPINTWVTDSESLQADGVQISVYSSAGRLIPTGHVHLYYDLVKGKVYIAIAAHHTSKCIGTLYPDLYMTMQYDLTRNTPLVYQTIVVSDPGAVTSLIQAQVSAYRASTIVVINGWSYNPSQLPTLAVGDIVHIQRDPDVVGYCDITVDDRVTGYYSSLYQEYREILHIPKVLNPTNILLSSNTLDMIVFDPATGKGIYGHRIDPTALEPVTHNDFSVGRTRLQAFQDSLQARSVKVRLYVRYSTDKQKLGTEAFQLEDLYTLNDQAITDQLAGIAVNQIEEWRASSLETSRYLRIMETFKGFGNDNVLPSFVPAFGYFEVAASLGQQIRRYTYLGAQVEITKPARLVNMPCQALVYCNGRKVPEYQYVITDHRADAFLLGFKAEAYIPTGAKIVVYITESVSHIVRRATPSVGSPSVTLPNDDYYLVEHVPYASDKTIWGGTTRTGYRVLALSPADYTVVVQTNGSAVYTFATKHFGKTFYCIPIPGQSSEYYDLDPYLTQSEAIVIPLVRNDDTNASVPLVPYGAIEIYVNGCRLIEGLDYTCAPVKGEQNDVLQLLLSITNQSYLKLGQSGNLLEVTTHGDIAVSTDSGYVFNDSLYRDSPLMMWHPYCGRAYVDGLLVDSFNEVGNHLVSTSPLRGGAPYHTEWSLSYGAAKLLRSYNPNDDRSLRTRVGELLGRTPVSYPSVVVLDRLHALYSTYLATIVKDVSEGSLRLVNEPRDEAFLDQLKAYRILFERDPILYTPSTMIDRRFISLAAHYTNLAVSDPDQMLLVQRLVTLLLSPAALSIQEVLI